jgi:hypothetical protein
VRLAIKFSQTRHAYSLVLQLNIELLTKRVSIAQLIAFHVLQQDAQLVLPTMNFFKIKHVQSLVVLHNIEQQIKLVRIVRRAAIPAHH